MCLELSTPPQLISLHQCAQPHKLHQCALPLRIAQPQLLALQFALLSQFALSQLCEQHPTAVECQPCLTVDEVDDVT